jgi:hypothetical protein
LRTYNIYKRRIFFFFKISNKNFSFFFFWKYFPCARHTKATLKLFNSLSFLSFFFFNTFEKSSSLCVCVALLGPSNLSIRM